MNTAGQNPQIQNAFKLAVEMLGLQDAKITKMA